MLHSLRTGPAAAAAKPKLSPLQPPRQLGLRQEGARPPPSHLAVVCCVRLALQLTPLTLSFLLYVLLLGTLACSALIPILFFFPNLLAWRGA